MTCHDYFLTPEHHREISMQPGHWVCDDALRVMRVEYECTRLDKDVELTNMTEIAEVISTLPVFTYL